MHERNDHRHVSTFTSRHPLPYLKSTAPISLAYISHRSYHLLSSRHARFAPHVTPNPAPSFFSHFQRPTAHTYTMAERKAVIKVRPTNTTARARDALHVVCMVHSLWFDAEASLRAACGSPLARLELCAMQCAARAPEPNGDAL